MNEIRALLDAFDTASSRGERCAMATVVGVQGSAYRQPGARMLVAESGKSTGTISAGCLEADVIEHAKRVMESGEAKLVHYDNRSASDELAWGLGLGCNGIVSVLIEALTATSLHIEALRRSRAREVTIEHRNGFVETLLPPVPLLIFGAGSDVLPVMKLAQSIGWQTEVVDPQGRRATASRFAIADKVTLARPDDVATHVAVTSRTMALVMSHNYVHDLTLLRFLLASPARYIGVVGARHRAERMVKDLDVREPDLRRLHAPVGLDIGANNPAEIALSIVAEVRAVLDGRAGGMLRERGDAMHRMSVKDVHETPVVDFSRAFVTSNVIVSRGADR
jgi:xanthine dehydrogenase accessory factor